MRLEKTDLGPEASYADIAGHPVQVGYVNFQPFGYVHRGQLTGTDIDVWRMVAGRLGLRANYRLSPFIGELPNQVKITNILYLYILVQ